MIIIAQSTFLLYLVGICMIISVVTLHKLLWCVIGWLASAGVMGRCNILPTQVEKTARWVSWSKWLRGTLFKLRRYQLGLVLSCCYISEIYDIKDTVNIYDIKDTVNIYDIKDTVNIYDIKDTVNIYDIKDTVNIYDIKDIVNIYDIKDTVYISSLIIRSYRVYGSKI